MVNGELLIVILERNILAEGKMSKKAKWNISWDGYYPYCSNCSYEPDYNEGIQKICPHCGSSMTNYEELSASRKKDEKDGYQMLYELVTEEDKI